MMVVQEGIDLVGSNTPGTRYVGREARPAGLVGAKMAQRYLSHRYCILMHTVQGGSRTGHRGDWVKRS
jgi:hypothetical protein